MDLTQLEQMVTWLDQQRRRTDQEMRKLEQRLTSQAGIIEDQARRIQQLESELAAARSQLAEYASLQEALENLRKDVRATIERREEERLARERDQERLRAAEREKWGREIAELRKELERIAALEEILDGFKAEDRRLGEQVMRLREQVVEIDRRSEEALRTVTLLSEQRSQDHKRIGQLQGETVELFRRLEALAGKLPLLEEKLQRQDNIVRDVREVVESIRREESAFLEEVRQAEVDREKKVHEWQKVFEEMKAQVADALKRFERFEVQYDKAVRAVADIERWKESLHKDVHEIREAQRVAEEALRRAMREFESEQEKRWKKQVLEWDYKWQEQNRRIDALDEVLKAVQKQLAMYGELLDAIWRLQEHIGSHQLGEAQRLLQVIEEGAEKREKILKSYGVTR